MKSQASLPPTLNLAAPASTQDVNLISWTPAPESLNHKVVTHAQDVEFEEESLVIDDRFGLSPAQIVESKLSYKLQETSLPVSHLQTRNLLRRR